MLKSSHESAGCARRCAARAAALPALGRHRGVAPVRGIDDERRAPGPHRLQALVEPRVVVRAVPAVGTPIDVGARLGPLRGQVQEVVEAIEGPLLQLGRPLLGQELLVQIGRAHV